jgi:hypothetical protein
MAFTKEVLDEILKDYHGPDDFYGPQGIMKQLTRALVERTMEAELTFHLGYEKHDQGEKTLTNRRNGKTAKEPGTDDGPMTGSRGFPTPSPPCSPKRKSNSVSSIWFATRYGSSRTKTGRR